jgi:hypothetical protein
MPLAAIGGAGGMHGIHMNHETMNIKDSEKKIYLK